MRVMVGLPKWAATSRVYAPGSKAQVARRGELRVNSPCKLGYLPDTLDCSSCSAHRGFPVTMLASLQARQTPALRNRQAPALEARLEHGPEGHAVRPAAQAPAETRRVLPAVPLRLDHQQLQPPLPGLLGRCAAKQQTIAPAAFHKLVREAQADGQRLLRHRRRRAVHAPAAARHARRAPRLLLPGLHQRPLHHRREGASGCGKLGNVTPLDQRRGHRDRQRRAPRPGRTCCRRRCRACRTASKQQGLHRRLHQPLPDEHRRPADREVGRSADRHGRDVHLVPRLPADGPGRRTRTCA